MIERTCTRCGCSSEVNPIIDRDYPSGWSVVTKFGKPTTSSVLCGKCSAAYDMFLSAFQPAH